MAGFVIPLHMGETAGELTPPQEASVIGGITKEQADELANFITHKLAGYDDAAWCIATEVLDIPKDALKVIVDAVKSITDPDEQFKAVGDWISEFTRAMTDIVAASSAATIKNYGW